MGSGQFTQTEYEKNRAGGTFNISSIRAVLDNFIIREVQRIEGNFDTIINDRIVEWRQHLKKKKLKKFIYFFIFSIFLAIVSDIYVEKYTLATYLTIGAMAFIPQFIYYLVINGQVSTKYIEEEIGVKKALKVIFFESLMSVHIVHLFVFIIITIILALLAYTSLIDYFVIVVKELSVILSRIIPTDGAFNPKEILYSVFIYNTIFIFVDYIFWFIAVVMGAKRLAVKKRRLEELEEED